MVLTSVSAENVMVLTSDSAENVMVLTSDSAERSPASLSLLECD